MQGKASQGPEKESADPLRKCNEPSRELYSAHEILYGNVGMKPLILQDDVTRASGGSLEAQASNLLKDSVAESKLLTFDQSKSKYIVDGRRKCKEKLLSEKVNQS